jgi:antitoxin HicB
MAMAYRIPLELESQPEGGYTVTSPVLPELVTEGDTVEEALEHVNDAFKAVLELYEDEGRVLPDGLLEELGEGHPIHTERLVPA